MKSYIYLASPYTALHDDNTYDDVLMDERHRMTMECYYKLLSAGLVVFCPIAMTHFADCLCRNKFGSRLPLEFWYEFSKSFMQYASQLYVLKLPGWENSKGIREEINIAKSRNMPIAYLEFNPEHGHILST